jgi:hypothetical protein
MGIRGAQSAPSFSALRSTCASSRLASGETVCNSIQTTLCLLCIQFFPTFTLFGEYFQRSPLIWIKW